MNDMLLIPVSIAELFDKISILEIKLEELTEPTKLKHVSLELNALRDIVKKNDLFWFFQNELYVELKITNHKLWNICEIRREQERTRDFGDKFIDQSRNEYLTNDNRALIKRKINDKLNSTFVEVKSYK